MAKQMMGIGLIYGLSLAALSGDMTGPPPEDEEEKKKWDAEGKQAYKWRIPGTQTWVTWNNLGALSVPFSVAFGVAELQRKYEKGEIPPEKLAALEETISTVGGGLAKSFVDSSLMTSVARISDALTRGGKTMDKLIASTLAQMVPAAATMRQTANYLDPYQRDPQTITERIQAGIPLKSQTVTPKMNLGEPMENRRKGTMENFFPYTRIHPSTDEVATQYAADMAMGEETAVKMTADQKRRWDVERGKAAREAAVAFYKTTKAAPSPERTENLKRYVTKYQGQAREKFYRAERLGRYAGTR